MNCDHVCAELLDCLLGPLARGVNDVLIVHLDRLGHADRHIEDVHGDLGRIGHSGIWEERQGLLAAELYHVSTGPAVALGGTQGDLLDGGLPGLIGADGELGSSQCVSELPGGNGCGDGSCGSGQLLWWGCDLGGHGHGLQQVGGWVANSLGELQELHGDLGNLLAEVIGEEWPDATSAGIYLNLYIALDLDTFEGLDVHL